MTTETLVEPASGVFPVRRAPALLVPEKALTTSEGLVLTDGSFIIEARKPA